MVRPHESGGPRSEELLSCCTDPAGASPAPVSTGAPGSRPQARGESPASRAGRQEPLRRERARGPQHEVNPAASSEEQWGSRAAHFTAKATSAAQGSGRESAAGPPGVWGAAREQGLMRKRRDPPAPPSSRQGAPYKPKVKAGAAQRESEGTVVPMMATTNNATGGKSPWGGRAGKGGKHEGMAGKPGPNHPRGPVPADKVRQLRRQLYVAAKRSPGRRFHALYDRIHRSDVLWEAWRRVRRNKGSAGVDAQTLAEVESYGVDRFLEEIATELRAGRYRPRAVLRRYIPKAGAACNDVDHAGESPAAAIARFGCVAMPDASGGRPRAAKAQAKVLAAVCTTHGRTCQEGERRLGPQRARTPQRRKYAHVKQVVGQRAAELLRFGRRPMDAGEGNGPMQPASAPAYGWRHQLNGRPRAACHTRLVTNVSRQKRHQRLTVRRLTANLSHSRSSRSRVGPSRKTGKSSTSTPKNTFRPRNRSEAGVTRRRHPSVAQQKLNRTVLSGPSPAGPPRGFRSYRALCSAPPHAHPARRASAARSSSSFNSRSKHLES